MKRFSGLPPLVQAACAVVMGVVLEASGWTLLAVQSPARWMLAYPLLVTCFLVLVVGACAVPVQRWHWALVALAEEAELAAAEDVWSVPAVRVARWCEGAGVGDGAARELRWRDHAAAWRQEARDDG